MWSTYYLNANFVFSQETLMRVSKIFFFNNKIIFVNNINIVFFLTKIVFFNILNIIVWIHVKNMLNPSVIVTGRMIYDSLTHYAISVNLCHFTRLFTGIMIYDAISVKLRLFHRVSACSINVYSWLVNIYFNIRGHVSLPVAEKCV